MCSIIILLRNSNMSSVKIVKQKTNNIRIFEFCKYYQLPHRLSIRFYGENTLSHLWYLLTIDHLVDDVEHGESRVFSDPCPAEIADVQLYDLFLSFYDASYID